MPHLFKKFASYLVLITLFTSVLSCGPDRPRSDKIEILFLGHDSKHHDSEQYMPILASHVATKGINFTYTSNPEDLNTENLAKYD
ncbi:MAG: ThuA domain-containing protein, partial [Cyclobacteriaceae bacterium]|nr:ThuA domain-containing protein [Cyclobacteriaceae bacterium]